MSISLFNTRTMLEALQNMPPVRTFFKSLFTVRPASESAYIDIDIVEGNRRPVGFTSPKVQGTMVEKLGYSTKSFKPPYVKPKMVLDSEALRDRQPGENIYSGGISPAQRRGRFLADSLMRLDEMIVRREEMMCSEVLQTGALSISGEGVPTTSLDFGINSDHIITYTSTDLWSDTTNSDPIAQWTAQRKLIQQNGHANPTDIIIGETAWEYLIKNTKFLAQLDTRRITLGELIPEVNDFTGVDYKGRINEIGCNLWSYNEWYEDDNGDLQPLMNAKKTLMLARQARRDFLYGAIEDVTATAAVSRFPKNWIEEDPSAVFLMLQSAPLPVPVQVNAVVCAQVLA